MKVPPSVKAPRSGISAMSAQDLSLGKDVPSAKMYFVGNRVVIGNHCKIQNNVLIYDNVTLEDDVFCGPSMVFTNVYNPRAAIVRKEEYRSTLICQGATLGANCTVVCSVNWTLCLRWSRSCDKQRGPRLCADGWGARSSNWLDE
jgi:NDP-sugar pyrophosphorylase family protein